MTLLDLIRLLHCPYCGAPLTVERLIRSGTELAGDGGEYGVVRCACYRYPIIDGILVLRQQPGFDSATDPAVALIEQGRLGASLKEAASRLSPIPPVNASSRRFVRPLRKLSTTLWQRSGACENGAAGKNLQTLLKSWRPTVYADYLYNRHANVSFMAAVPLQGLFGLVNGRTRPIRIVDLNCGVGHATFSLQTFYPEAEIFATDHDFVNLCLARRHFAPRARFICMDTELPLPFADKSLDGVLCLDGLHYVRSKRALVNELNRSVSPDGIWVFSHMHNALADNVAPGIPLSPDDYRRCFDFIPSRPLVEAEILRQFVNDGSVDLGTQAEAHVLNEAEALSLVASRRCDVFMHREHQDDALMDLPSKLQINPVYVQRRVANRIELRMCWPSEELERECQAVKEYLPAKLSLDASLVDALENGALKEADKAAIRPLVRSFVLLHLPPGYSGVATKAGLKRSLA